MKVRIFELLKEDKKIRIKLRQEFINLIRREVLKKYRTIKNCHRMMNIESYDAFLNWLKPTKEHQTNPPLKDFVKVIENLNVPKNLLFNNVLGFSLCGSPRVTYLPHSINLTPEVVLGIGMYVGDGGTSKSIQRVIFTNSELRLVDFFREWVLKYCLRIPSHETSLYIYCTEPWKIDKKILMEKFSIKSSQIKFYSGGSERPNYKFGTNNVVCKIVLDLFIQKVKNLCLRNKGFAKAYLSGIFLAEGNIYYKPEKYVRTLTIEMANKNEIKFIEKLLKMFGVTFKTYKKRTRKGHYVINIAQRKSLETLRDLEIFGLVKEKQKLLEEMCNSYTSKRSRWWN